MTALAYPFWNRRERRLRALWRLVLQLAAFLLLLIVLSPLAALLPRTPAAVWLAAAGTDVVAIITVWLACRALDRRPLADLGLHLDRDWWSDLGFGLVLGALLMAAVFAVAVAAGWAAVRANPTRETPLGPLPLALVVVLIGYVIVGIAEELFFRGYYLRNVAEGLRCRWIPPRAALLATAVLTSGFFAAAHGANPDASAMSWANTAIAGLLLAIPVIFTGRLGLPIGLHITWNFFQGGVFGFPVSGEQEPAALLALEPVKATLWTGGHYGPEGGLLGTAAFLAGIVLTLGWIRARYGPLRLQTAVAEYQGTTGASGKRLESPAGDATTAAAGDADTHRGDSPGSADSST